MSDNATALSTIDSPPPPADADYHTICAALMETARGRWFLAEYARRNRNADTDVLLAAIERIEAAIRDERGGLSFDHIRLDLQEMAKAIGRTKAEIAAIKPVREQDGKIGDATVELDSIVQSTETATSDILAAAELVQETAWTMREQGLDAGLCDQLDARATEIYLACEFQDLTGQRIQRVIQVLRYLEDRINAMIDIWGSDAPVPAAPPQPAGSDAAVSDQADVDQVMRSAPRETGNVPAALLDGDRATPAPANIPIRATASAEHPDTRHASIGDDRVPAVSWFDLTSAHAPPAETGNGGLPTDAEPPTRKEAPFAQASATGRRVTADELADLLFEPAAPQPEPEAKPDKPDKPDKPCTPLDFVMPDWTPHTPQPAKTHSPPPPVTNAASTAGRPRDPLAPLNAMSDEEKIALFS